MKNNQTKRVDFIRLKMVRESSIIYSNRTINSPKEASEVLRQFLENEDRETFIAIYLTTKNEPTAIHTISIGTLCASLVHPREVFKAGIMVNAAGIIFGHNHPSGIPEPSKEDIELTKRLKDAGNIIGIEILDHIIIGCEGKFVSLKERNQL